MLLISVRIIFKSGPNNILFLWRADFQEFKIMLDKKGGKLNKNEVYEYGKSQVSIVEERMRSIKAKTDKITQSIDTIIVINSIYLKALTSL